ncbi:hypothetical protein ACIBEJ_17175 [Nonomuraea sp. NPDC050790]|uniref:hypothetical protein n=1 Tax=Nonomuraea sp. NPDC050790 TaxID=3364371 RepID=UPI0037B60D0C
MRDIFIKAAIVISAATMAVTGVWMRIDPAGFAEWANWPLHVHFLHDAGVFQMGIALMMLTALWWRDVVTVVLVGFVFANTFHAVNHLIDNVALGGGSGSDWWSLGLVSVLATAALVVRRRAVGSHVNGRDRHGRVGGNVQG